MKVALVLLISLTFLCSSSIIISFFCIFMKVLGYNCVFFPSLDFALNCQVFQKYGAGICETAEDNGVSMECPPDLNACWYIYEGKDHKDKIADYFQASNYRGPG